MEYIYNEEKELIIIDKLEIEEKIEAKDVQDKDK
jgi:hypothetical protein